MPLFSAKHIIKIDGKVGLFKGLGPRLCAGTIGTVVHSKIAQVGMNILRVYPHVQVAVSVRISRQYNQFNPDSSIGLDGLKYDWKCKHYSLFL